MNPKDKGSSTADARPDLARDVAEFGAGLTIEGVPPEVVAAASRNIADTLACAWAGRTAPGVDEVMALVKGWGGKGEATLFCDGTRVPAHHAAWVNGVMGHARDFDDTHDAAVLHAGVSVVPAALAAAELVGPDATGADILAGVAAGLELTCRLGLATSIGIIESGFIYSALFGYFGATLAAARVARLDADTTLNALGIVYSQASGTHQVTRDAALTKRMQPGFAARAAVLSVQMSRVGIRGARAVFEGEDGLFRTYLRGRADGQRVRAGLGSVYDFLDLSYKPHPCCRFNHAAIDAAMQLRATPGFDASAVSAIIARVNHQAHEAVCTPESVRKAPREGVQAQFSLPYTVACALIDGAVRIDHFAPEALERADLRALAGRVTCLADPEIERRWGRSISPAQLVVETPTGTLEAWVEFPKGHPRAPMSEADFQAKALDCLSAGGAVDPETGARVLAGAVADLPARQGVAALIGAMIAPARP